MRTGQWPLTKLAFVTLILFVGHVLLYDPSGQKEAKSSGALALALAPMPANLTALIRQSDLMVRGRVVATKSFWNEDHSAIETANQIAIRYTLWGDAPKQLIVRTLGGVLVDEDLGMDASTAATFTPQEEVFVFLRKTGEEYRVVNEEAGKYLIGDGNATNALNTVRLSLRDFLERLGQGLAQQGRVTQLPENWRSLEPVATYHNRLAPQSYVYNNHKWPGANPVVKYKVNINTTQAGGANGSVDDFRQAIIAAATTWNMVPGAAFTFQYDGETTATQVGIQSPGVDGVNEIIFMHQGVANPIGLGIYFFRKSDGLLIEGDIWLNDDVAWDATGAPNSDELDVQSGVLHELGHLLSLGHDSDPAAVMYISLLMGSLKRELYANDVAGISFIYPCNSQSCNSPDVPLDPTPTTETPPSPTVTATSTPLPGTIPAETPTPPASNKLNVYLPAVQK